MGSFSIWHWLIVIIIFLTHLIFIPAVKKAGFSGWWVALSLIPGVDLVLLWVFAYAKWPAQASTHEVIKKVSKQIPAAKALETKAIVRVETPQTEYTNAHENVTKILATPHANATTPSETLWAAAFAEFDSAARRPGLWAKTFADANGNEAEAKAAYLRTRVNELEVEEQTKNEQLRRAEEIRNAAHQLQMAQAVAHKREAERIEAARAYAALPKGICPSCDAVIPLASETCPKCPAMFGSQAAWKPLPLKEA